MPAEPHLDIELAPFALGSPHFEAAIRIYATVFMREWEPSAALLSEQAGRRDFRGHVALVDGTVIAMGFGARAEAGHYWYDAIAELVGADCPALHDPWNLIELAVLADYRRFGIGTRLVDSLLAAQPYSRALLSVIVGNTTARRFYERSGWEYLHQALSFATAPHKQYAIMGREVGSAQSR
jgi:ribosomal protein S18 acetylase RimI-like enzyme